MFIDLFICHSFMKSKGLFILLQASSDLTKYHTCQESTLSRGNGHDDARMHLRTPATKPKQDKCNELFIQPELVRLCAFQNAINGVVVDGAKQEVQGQSLSECVSVCFELKINNGGKHSHSHNDKKSPLCSFNFGYWKRTEKKRINKTHQHTHTQTQNVCNRCEMRHMHEVAICWTALERDGVGGLCIYLKIYVLSVAPHLISCIAQCGGGAKRDVLVCWQCSKTFSSFPL